MNGSELNRYICADSLRKIFKMDVQRVILPYAKIHHREHPHDLKKKPKVLTVSRGYTSRHLFTLTLNQLSYATLFHPLTSCFS